MSIKAANAVRRSMRRIGVEGGGGETFAALELGGELLADCGGDGEVDCSGGGGDRAGIEPDAKPNNQLTILCHS
jgi:hypothetical protein